MKDVKIGMIGAGWMAKAHTNAFHNARMLFGKDFANPVYYIIADNQADLVEKRKSELAYQKSTTNWEDVVKDPDVDLVDITTPNSLHYVMAKEALENGKHVFCEKPLCISSAESKELAALAKQKGVVNYVGFSNVMNPANAFAAKLIHEGKLGQITRFICTYDQDVQSDPEAPMTWRFINKHAGCGVLADLTSHLLSVSQWLLGDIDKVVSTTDTIYSKRPVEPASQEMGIVENEDIVNFLARFSNGVVGCFGSSRVATGRKNRFTYEVQGTEGTIYYDLERQGEIQVYFRKDCEATRGFRTVYLNKYCDGYDAFQPVPGLSLAFDDMKILQAYSVMQAITEKAPYICDFQMGAKVDSVIDAVLRSVKSGRWEQV